MAALIAFYRSGAGNDSPQILAYFKENPETGEILRNKVFWDMDLTEIPGFEAEVNDELAKRYALPSFPGLRA